MFSFRPIPNTFQDPAAQESEEFNEWVERAWRRFDRQYVDAVNAFARGENVAGGFDHAGLTVLS